MDTGRQIGRTTTHRVRIAAHGRLVIPAEVRQELGIKAGDYVILTQDNGGFSVTTVEQAIRRARERVARYVRPGVSLAQELLTERREEAARESSKGKRRSVA